MKVIDLYLYGEITPYEDPEYGYIGTKHVVSILNKYPDAEEINVHINSPGGEVSEGFAIHDILTSSGKKVNTIVEGYCGSIATVIFLAGESRKITENSKFMIHNPWGIIEGDTDQIAKYADDLLKVENLLIDFYNQKTGIDKNQLDELMKKETEYTAKEAKEFGFATEVIETVRALAIFKPKNKEMKNKNQKVGLIARLTKAMKALSTDDEPKALSLEVEGGGTIDIETESDTPAVGDAVTVDGEAAPDGEHVLADGRKVVTAEGKITEIIEPEVEDTDDEDDMKALAGLIGDAVAKAIKPIQDSVKALQDKQAEQEQASEEIVNSIELIGKNISSDGFKHSKKTKSSPKGKKQDATIEDVKKSVIAARRKAEGLTTSEEEEEED